MRKQIYRFAGCSLIAAALLFTACGKKTSEGPVSAAGQALEIPEAPAAAIQAIVREIAKGDGAVLWQAMPESYQNDVNEIARLAGTKVDSEIYDQVFATIRRFAEVADKQKEYFFYTGLGAPPPEEEVDKLREAWPSFVNLINTLTSSAIASTGSLQSFDGKAFFAETVSSLLRDIDVLAKIKPDPDQPAISEYCEAVVNYVNGSDGACTLEMVMPNGALQVQDFIKVEGSWVPQDMANQWAAGMTRVRKQLEAIDTSKLSPQKAQIMSLLVMIDSLISQLEAAETQEQFDQALQGALMPLMGLMLMGQGMGIDTPSGVPAMPVAP